MAYLSLDEYKTRHPEYVPSAQGDKDLEQTIKMAERHVDSLTY